MRVHRLGDFGDVVLRKDDPRGRFYVRREHHGGFFFFDHLNHGVDVMRRELVRLNRKCQPRMGNRRAGVW